MKNYVLKNLIFVSVSILILGACDFGTDPEPENTAPTINNQSFSVSEEAEIDDVVGTVVANDSDGDDLSFTITSGNDGNAFSISADGEITIAAALDFDAQSEYTLSVEVSDGDDSASGDVTINVTEGSDPPPTASSFVFDEEGYVIENARLIDEGPSDPNEINENTHYNYFFIFTDGEFTSDGGVQGFDWVLELDLYTLGTSSWSPGTYTVGNSDNIPWIYMWRDLVDDDDDLDGDEFYVEKSGSVTVSVTGNTYTFTIDAVMEDEDGVLEDKNISGTFSVDLTPVTGNENNPPSISDQSFSVDENTVNETLVGTVAASDEDGDPISYFIEGGNTDDAFAINESTGQLTVNNSAALDYETIQVIEIVVGVSDGEDGNQAIITVNINDVDEGGGTSGDFTFGGNSFVIENARLYDEGASDPNETNSNTHYNYFFIFTDGDFASDGSLTGFDYVLEIDLYTLGTSAWSPGTYTIGDSDNIPWIYMWRDLVDDDDDLDGDEFYVEKSGTVTVSVTGSTYTFTIDAVMEDEDGVAADKNISGSFTVDLTPQ
ncbi:cadherin repeat domain-containing protein [Ekhidna sp.]|uniref:cadherin repeat domain-containing protein n=1 Tax=Ekhidna sp. TaxID=2608089 RepID=UPI003B504A82